MSIVTPLKSKRVLVPSNVGTMARLAILSSAVTVGAPKIAQGALDIMITPGNVSWFSNSIWTLGGTNTGTLPEVATNATNFGVNINANNATMPSQGVLFDPANQIGNANYVANTIISAADGGPAGTFYLSNANGTTVGTSAPNKLTVDSGTLEMFHLTIGRDSSAVLVQNGGLIFAEGIIKIGSAHTPGGPETIQGSGTYEYHGGTLVALNQIQVASGFNTDATDPTVPTVGKFVIYNDGINGAIEASNGFAMSPNMVGAGSTGIVEFHYDLNQAGVGNVRPVQGNINTTNGDLILNNSTNQISELNLVLDSAVSVVGGNVQNLGLFKDITITGNGTFPKIFYATDGTTGYTQGATISAAFGGSTYSWTISYSGIITFTNTSTSAYDSTAIQAVGGNDVVLTAVPEPAAAAMLGTVGGLILARRKRMSSKIG